MEKWEQQLKNSVNREMPQMVEDRIQASLGHLPKKKRFSMRFYVIAATVLVFLLPFGAAFISPTFAETVKSLPVIGSVFELVGGISEKKGNEQGLTTLLGQQIEFDGHKITFTESLYDGAQIHIGYIIESGSIDGEQLNSDFLSDIHVTIKGNHTGYGMGARGNKLDNGDYAGTLNIHLHEDLLDQFMLKLHSYNKKGWQVELPIEKQGNAQAYLVNETKEIEDLMIHYDKVTFFPTSTEIAFRHVIEEKVLISDKYMRLDYQVIDDKGRVLQPLSGGGGGGAGENGKLLQTYEYYFEPIDDVPKSITVKPYLRSFNEKTPEFSREKWEGKEMSLSQGEIGHVTILDITKEKEGITVTVETEGENASSQAQVWIEDEKGNRYYSEGFPIRVEGTISKYQIFIPSVPQLDNLYIATAKESAINYLEDLEVTIELDNASQKE